MIKKFMLVILLGLACFLSAVPFAWASFESSSASESSKPLKKKKAKKSKKKLKKKKKVASKKKKLKTKKSSRKAKKPSQKVRNQSRYSLPPEDETPSLMASLEDSSTATDDSLPPPPEEAPAETAAAPDPTPDEATEAMPDAPADELEGGTTLMEESTSKPTDTSADSNLATPGEIIAEKEVAPVTETDPEKSILLEKEPVPTSENERVIALEDAMVGAYQQSDLLSSEYSVKASQLKLAHAERGWLPVTSANMGYNYNSSSVTQKNFVRNGPPGLTPTSITDSASASAGVSLKQNLYQGGATVATILAHRKGLDASFAEYLAKEKEVLKKAIAAYITLFVRQEAFRLNQANQKLLEETLEVNKNRYEFGELTRYDVAAAQAKLDRAKSEVIGAFAEVEKAKATFLKETGVSPNQTLKKVPFPTQLLPKSKKEAMDIAIKMSPELKNVSAKAEQAAARADAALGNFLPSLDVGVNASKSLADMWNKQSYYGGKGKEEDSKWGAGATLTIPLDFAGSAQTSIRAEKYEAAQARLIALYARRDILSMTSQAWDTLEAAKAKITQLKSQVEAAKIAVEVVREEFLAGTKTTLEVLSAEQESFSAQVSLIEAEQQEIMAAYELLYRMGILSAEALNLNVTTYTPHKEKVPFWGLNIDHDPRLSQQEALDMNMAPWEKSL